MTRAFALFLLLSAAAPTLAADVVTGLDGAWTAISAERDGAPAGELVGHRIEFKDDRFRILKDDNLLFGGHFTSDPGKTPAQIDFTIEEGAAKGQSWAGIYKIENEVLTICDNAANPAVPRQQGFTAPKGSGYVCLNFKR
ncbi:MAG: TIGR03067 domain-containing protein [Parvibaculaceae bacterium]